MIKKESISTTSYAGTNPENTRVWSHWAIKHLAEMRVLRAGGILGLENKNWRNIAEHLLVVNATALYIAQKLTTAGQPVDEETVDQASILHDATKRLERQKGISYANEHYSSIRKDFLAQSGYSSKVIAAAEYTGRVPEMFKDPPEQVAAIATKPMEHLIVAYADARVRSTEIVPLEIARDLNKQKVPDDTAIYDQWYSFYKEVEARIFKAMNDPSFTPESINNSSVLEFVAQSPK